MWNSWTSTMHYQVVLAVLAVTFVYATTDDSNTNNEQKRIMSYAPFGLDELASFNNFYGLEDSVDDRPKRDEHPGLLRFGKRSQMFVRLGRSDSMTKKEMPGVLRFGKRSIDSMDSMPGMMRFGKRSETPGLLRFGKRDADMPGLMRFGKRDADMPGLMRFGKRDSDMPGLMRFGRK